MNFEFHSTPLIPKNPTPKTKVNSIKTTSNLRLPIWAARTPSATVKLLQISTAVLTAPRVTSRLRLPAAKQTELATRLAAMAEVTDRDNDPLGAAEEKDSYARIAKLDLIGGPGASQVICRPLFTHPDLPPRLLQSAHAQRRNAEKWHMQFIGYTADAQPEAYAIKGQQHAAPPFERALEQLLGRYSPRRGRPEAERVV